MRYVVLSDRLGWPRGTEVDEGNLSGNIAVLVQAGHVALVADEPKGKTKAKLEPVQPDPVDDDSAEQPEEQD
jgi:hypothetical protein